MTILPIGRTAGVPTVHPECSAALRIQDERSPKTEIEWISKN